MTASIINSFKEMYSTQVQTNGDRAVRGSETQRGSHFFKGEP